MKKYLFLAIFSLFSINLISGDYTTRTGTASSPIEEKAINEALIEEKAINEALTKSTIYNNIFNNEITTKFNKIKGVIDAKLENLPHSPKDFEQQAIVEGQKNNLNQLKDLISHTNAENFLDNLKTIQKQLLKLSELEINITLQIEPQINDLDNLKDNISDCIKEFLKNDLPKSVIASNPSEQQSIDGKIQQSIDGKINEIATKASNFVDLTYSQNSTFEQTLTNINEKLQRTTNNRISAQDFFDQVSNAFLNKQSLDNSIGDLADTASALSISNLKEINTDEFKAKAEKFLDGIQSTKELVSTLYSLGEQKSATKIEEATLIGDFAPQLENFRQSILSLKQYVAPEGFAQKVKSAFNQFGDRIRNAFKLETRLERLQKVINKSMGARRGAATGADAENTEGARDNQQTDDAASGGREVSSQAGQAYQEDSTSSSGSSTVDLRSSGDKVNDTGAGSAREQQREKEATQVETRDYGPY